MKALKLNSIDKLYFGYHEISAVLGISEASARVVAGRYVRAGLLIRVRRNLYVLSARWNNLIPQEYFKIANIALSPSYVSLLTALQYYEITSQVQRNVVECICLKRTREITVKKYLFSYTRIKQERFRAFDRSQGFFMATPEKAFLDALYLSSLGRYSLAGMEIDIGKLDSRELRKQAKAFPERVQRMMEDYE